MSKWSIGKCADCFWMEDAEGVGKGDWVHKRSFLVEDALKSAPRQIALYDQLGNKAMPVLRNKEDRDSVRGRVAESTRPPNSSRSVVDVVNAF